MLNISAEAVKAKETASIGQTIDVIKDLDKEIECLIAKK
jgi:hypothetical protein